MTSMLCSEHTHLWVAGRVGSISLLTAPKVDFAGEHLMVVFACSYSISLQLRTCQTNPSANIPGKGTWSSTVTSLAPIKYSQSHLKVGHGHSAAASPGMDLWVTRAASSAPAGFTSTPNSHDSAAALILTSLQGSYPSGPMLETKRALVPCPKVF